MKYSRRNLYLFFLICTLVLFFGFFLYPVFTTDSITNSNLMVKTWDDHSYNENSSGRDFYIVFIKGLQSYCDGTRNRNMGFGYLRNKLSSYGFHFNDEKFLQYSYAGGEVKGRKWFPNKYGVWETGQPIEISVKHLNDLIKDFSVVHPNARYVLVGHSLGGVIAYDYISKYIEDNWRIKGVITLNSPLTGSVYNIPYIVLNILQDAGSVFGSTAVRQLVSEYKYKVEVEKWRGEVARRVQKNGMRLATFATRQDLIVLARSAFLLDMNQKSATEGSIISVNRLANLPYSLLGHRQILKEDLVVDYIISIIN